MDAPQQVSILSLPFSVESEDGETYTLDLYKPTVDSVLEMWNRLSNVRVLFSDHVIFTVNDFTALIMKPTTVILAVDDIGVIYVTDVSGDGTADAHFVFWDRRTAGRNKLIMHGFNWFMRELELHRLNVSIPVYAFSALKRARKLGLRLEGVKRKARFYNGKWQDELLFGVLEEEATDEALENGRLARTPQEESWFGVISSDNELLTKVKEWSGL